MDNLLLLLLVAFVVYLFCKSQKESFKEDKPKCIPENGIICTPFNSCAGFPQEAKKAVCNAETGWKWKCVESADYRYADQCGQITSPKTCVQGEIPYCAPINKNMPTSWTWRCTGIIDEDLCNEMWGPVKDKDIAPLDQ